MQGPRIALAGFTIPEFQLVDGTLNHALSVGKLNNDVQPSIT